MSLDAWELAARQHGVVARHQLLELGYTSNAIVHRISSGRLHPVRRGVYAVGRPQVTAHGRFMAAVLACGPEAFLSHLSAGSLWNLLSFVTPECVHVSVPAHVVKRVSGIVVHRRRSLEQLTMVNHHSIPVTDAVSTLLDLATMLAPHHLETAINEADKRGLVSPEQLRSTLKGAAGRPGVRTLRTVLDRHTFRLTDSELERRFLPISRGAGLPAPETGRRLNGFNVDFFWPDLGLVVETDGLRYHRTPAAQARDRLRDQAHTAAGLTPLRFTHAQVAHQPQHAQTTLALVAQRLREA